MKLALIGDPVAHSRSPQVIRGFMQDAGIDGSYVTVRVPAGNAARAILQLRKEQFTGLNVTAPLKEEVVAVCDELDEDAQLAQAVNTIAFGTQTLGANTDGIGARSALETVLGQPVALERIGILGTGATARAILAQLRETDAYAFVWGRKQENLRRIYERFEAQPWPDHPPEIVVSALPPAVELPSEIVEALHRADVVMDVNYGERSTLESIAEREIVKGDLMLEAQARASFDFWLAHATVGFFDDQA
ncbi:MAG: hypothetical protein JOZ62_21680 [Acidobacteriaceae bacterium]|nr:hypothetical protein [Acidobacteriaceae bacterium]